jgi:hypothetical protein
MNQLIDELAEAERQQSRKDLVVGVQECDWTVFQRLCRATFLGNAGYVGFQPGRWESRRVQTLLEKSTELEFH